MEKKMDIYKTLRREQSEGPDVCAEGNWQKYFTERPEPFTAEEMRAWLDTFDGVALGSDAFFPFFDNIERARRSGVKYIASWAVPFGTTLSLTAATSIIWSWHSHT